MSIVGSSCLYRFCLVQYLGFKEILLRIKMNKTIGICGHLKTGCSTFASLLREFDETQLLDCEFQIAYMADGLEDLEHGLKGRYVNGFVAIERFRRNAKRVFSFSGINKKESERIINEFLNKITQLSWRGGSASMDFYLRSPLIKTITKAIHKFRLNKIYKNINKPFYYKKMLSVIPDNFTEASKGFVSDFLSLKGIDYYNKEKMFTIIDQAFTANDPVRCFKYFENPMAIIVDRDPRDYYIFVKNFLTGIRNDSYLPYDNVNDFIKWFRLVRRHPAGLRDRNDVIFFNFEELVHDYENTVKKVSEFVGVTKHFHKREFFNPEHFRCYTQLFKSDRKYESDIKTIERDLTEYLFPFENYPDIKL